MERARKIVYTILPNIDAKANTKHNMWVIIPQKEDIGFIMHSRAAVLKFKKNNVSCSSWCSEVKIIPMQFELFADDQSPCGQMLIMKQSWFNRPTAKS